MYFPYFFDIKKRTECSGIQELFKDFNYWGIMVCKLIKSNSGNCNSNKNFISDNDDNTVKNNDTDNDNWYEKVMIKAII